MCNYYPKLCCATLDKRRIVYFDCEVFKKDKLII